MRYVNTALASLILTALFFLAGCGPKKVVDETTVACSPGDLRVDVNHRSMDISWTNGCERLISGYNIYIADQPMAALASPVMPFNTSPYAGDTDPDDGVVHFEVDRLENGRKYYVSVRVVFPDQTLSPPSREVAAVCGPRGEIELSVRYKSDNDGFSFERNKYVRADNMENDLVFFSKDGSDYLDSPERLDGFIKANRLRKLSMRGSYDEVRAKASQFNANPTDDRVAVKKGDWLHLRTPDNKNALINVIDIYGNGADRKIKLFFAYSPLPGEMIF